MQHDAGLLHLAVKVSRNRSCDFDLGIEERSQRVEIVAIDNGVDMPAIRSQLQQNAGHIGIAHSSTSRTVASTVTNRQSKSARIS